MDLLKVIFITCYYPPQRFPRSIQISHISNLLKESINLKIVTLNSNKNIDNSLLEFTTLDNVVFAKESALSRFIDKSRGHRIKNALLPDHYYFKYFDFYKKCKRLIIEEDADIICTFGQPMSTHIAGLKIKNEFPDIKWFAHFSDPWIDNIFNEYNFWTNFSNQYYQDKVFNKADKLIFTSNETIDIVTKKYSNNVKNKSSIIPHCFNPSLFNNTQKQNNDKFTIRYLGHFYGNRQPDYFLKALNLIDKKILDTLSVEFIGSNTEEIKDKIFSHNLAKHVKTKQPVNYLESLKLMQESDLLLIIDAPAERSPYLPSKLIDYIGSKTPIFGITPNGAAQKLIEEMGFLTANPNNVKDIATKLETTLNNNMTDIPKNIFDLYSVANVIKKWEQLFYSSQKNKLVAP